MKILRFIILLISLPLSTYGTQHVITSFPYTASTAGTNYSDTFTINGTNLSTSGSALNITGHDLVFDLQSDTITFGTGNGNTNYGIQLGGSSYNIKIIGGTLYHGGLGDYNRCLFFGGTNDAYIENTNMRIAGSNGHCIYTPSISSPGNYNVEISGGHYRSDVTEYTSRCNYDGCVIVYENIFTTTSPDYGIKIHGINITFAPSQGIYVAGRAGQSCFTEVYACTLSSDARNLKYTSGDNTCLSAANPYLISGTRLAPGSKIHDNVLRSGTTYGGSRGMIFEMCAGTQANPIEVYNNDVDVHEGINLEEPIGNVQVLRMRFGNAYVHVHDNTFIGTGGIGMGSSYGGSVMVFRITTTNEEGHTPGHGHIIENNLFKANALTTGVDAIGWAMEGFDSLDNIFRYNRIESVGKIIAFGENNYGAHGVYLDNDTLVRLSPPTNPQTIIIGWSNYYSSDNDTLNDIVYLGGASENDINFWDSNSNYRLTRTVVVNVLDSTKVPIAGANVTISNNYGQQVFSDLTNASGQVIASKVSYRWEQNTGSDSLGYNDFQIIASNSGLIDTSYLTINASEAGGVDTLILGTLSTEVKYVKVKK